LHYINETGYFARKHAETSIKQESTALQPPSRFSEGYDESMEETLKPIRTRTENRTSGIFQDLRQQAEAMAHTPPRAERIPMAINPGLRSPDFMSMRNLSAEFNKLCNLPSDPIE